MTEKNAPERPPYKRLPPEERGPVPDLPPYPGLPSKTGRSSAMIVPVKRAPKKPSEEQPAGATDAACAESGSDPKPE